MLLVLVTTEESIAPAPSQSLKHDPENMELFPVPKVSVPEAFRVKLKANNGYSRIPRAVKVAKKDEANKAEVYYPFVSTHEKKNSNQSPTIGCTGGNGRKPRKAKSHDSSCLIRERNIRVRHNT